MLGIFFILLLMWALGMISSYTFGGAIHLLLVVALIVLVIRLTQGRNVA
ncbi:MAG: lmo0937 family membrane protein [Candidatus Angelobacter sp.]